MKNVKCDDCAEYINEWCERIIDSPYPDMLRDCEYFHEKRRTRSREYDTRNHIANYLCTDVVLLAEIAISLGRIADMLSEQNKYIVDYDDVDRRKDD